MMWWKRKRTQSNLKDDRAPVCDVVLPLPDPRAVVGALASLYRLQTGAENAGTFQIQMEPLVKSTLRIRGFEGIDLDSLTGCLRAVLARWNSGVSLTLSYRGGCKGALARSEGGILRIGAGYVESLPLEQHPVAIDPIDCFPDVLDAGRSLH